MHKKEVLLKKIEILDYDQKTKQTSIKIGYNSDNENKVILTTTTATTPQESMSHIIEQLKSQEHHISEDHEDPLPHYNLVRITNQEEITERMAVFFQEHHQKIQQSNLESLNTIKNQKITFS